MTFSAIIAFHIFPLLLVYSRAIFATSRPSEPPIGLRISPFGQSVNQPSHQQFVLTCRGFGAEPNLFSDLKWFDARGIEITETYSKRTNPDVKVEEAQFGVILLHFLNPMPDNSGQYRCSATFQHSDSFDAQIQINFFQDVQWEDCPQIQALVLGSTNERIRCKAKANPKPNINWSKDGHALDNNRRFQIDSDGIQVNDVIRESDGGVFRVRAHVTETGKLHDTFITVQIFVRPKISNFANLFEGIEGEEATLSCGANGVPEPMFTWLDPNRRNLSSVGSYSVNRNTGSLVITRVRKLEDNGTFTCIAQNNAGIDQKSTNLFVLKKPKINSFLNQSFDENKESKLECRSIGEPKPKLSIRRDGDSRQLALGDARVSMETATEGDETILRLTLSQTRRSDDGLYFCRAENRAGVVETVGHLEVRFSPDLSRTPLTSVKQWNSNPINITCIADAIPNATIRWWFRGLDLHYSTNNVYTIQDNTAGKSRLYINAKQGSAQRDIYGQYRCEAINSLGASDLRIQLDQAFRPGAIMQTTHEKISSTTITFRLMAPSFDGGLPIKTIHCQYRREDKPWEEMLVKSWPLNTLSDQYFLDGLRPRTRYLFRFAAQNDVGIGDYSSDKLVLTERETRPETPRFHNLPPEDAQTRERVSPFADQFQAMWTLPADNGRQIKYFELKCYSVRKTESGFEANTFDERVHSVSMTDQSMTSFTLRDLKSNTYYRIELRANNELGFSDVETLVFKTADKNGLSSDQLTNDSFVTSRLALAPIIGIIIASILVLLIAMDIIFFYRYRVGAIHFIASHVFSTTLGDSTGGHKTTPTPDHSVDTSHVHHSSIVHKSRDNHGFESLNQQNYEQNEPFIGQSDVVSRQLNSFRSKDTTV